MMFRLLMLKVRSKVLYRYNKKPVEPWPNRFYKLLQAHDVNIRLYHLQIQASMYTSCANKKHRKKPL